MKAASSAHRIVSAVTVTFLLTGCGTFQLASSVTPLSSKTQEQQQLDNLACKDQAKLEANTTGRQTGAFLLGLTIVGAPVAFEMEKAKQREVYKSCMEAKGYRVLPPNDQTANAPPSSIPPGSPQPAVTPAPAKPPVVIAPLSPTTSATIVPQSQAKDEAAQLQKLNELRDRGLITSEEYEKKRKEILDRL